jgi:hypothetical protein
VEYQLTSFFIMGIFAIWAFLAICVGLFAGSRGRGSGSWFFISLILSPLLGLILLALLPNLANKKTIAAGPTDKTHVRCPKCAEFVLPEASVCKHCGSELTPDPGHFMRIHREEIFAKDKDQQDTLMGIAFVAAVGFVIWMVAKNS